jgi:hypothetical protein
VFASTLQSELAYGNTTWINLEKLLGKEAMKDCFFTTAIMGLRKSGQKDDQASYAFSTKGKDFLQLNLSFFREQLENADPDVIIALGLPVVHFLSAIFTREMHAFKELKSCHFKRNLVVPILEMRIIKLKHQLKNSIFSIKTDLIFNLLCKSH